MIVIEEGLVLLAHRNKLAPAWMLLAGMALGAVRGRGRDEHEWSPATSEATWLA